MRPSTGDQFRIFFTGMSFVILLVLATGCTLNVIPKIKDGNMTAADPVTGTWNGFTAKSTGSLVPDNATINEVEKIRLNIYSDLSFSYTKDFTIQNGTLNSTGKGNYVVKANETDTERKYFHYNEEKDTLQWESRDMIIEFRRNERALSASELSAYNDRLLKNYLDERQAASITPVPPKVLAQIFSRGFGYDPTASTVYQMNGKVEIGNGIYDSVSVILRYPDNDTFQGDVGGMGGCNFTRKDFRIIIHDRLSNQTPGLFVRLDSAEYKAVQSGNTTGGFMYTAYEPAA